MTRLNRQELEHLGMVCSDALLRQTPKDVMIGRQHRNAATGVINHPKPAR